MTGVQTCARPIWVPLRRYGVPEEVAHGILHLALPASGYITGHLLMVDGGMTIKNN